MYLLYYRVVVVPNDVLLYIVIKSWHDNKIIKKEKRKKVEFIAEKDDYYNNK